MTGFFFFFKLIHLKKYINQDMETISPRYLQSSHLSTGHERKCQRVRGTGCPDCHHSPKWKPLRMRPGSMEWRKTWHCRCPREHPGRQTRNSIQNHYWIIGHGRSLWFHGGRPYSPLTTLRYLFSQENEIDNTFRIASTRWITVIMQLDSPPVTNCTHCFLTNVRQLSVSHSNIDWM